MRRRKVVSYEFLRSDVLALGFGLLSIIFITKLYSIQVKKHGVLSAKAQEQYQNLSTIQAKEEIYMQETCSRLQLVRRLTCFTLSQR